MLDCRPDWTSANSLKRQRRGTKLIISKPIIAESILNKGLISADGSKSLVVSAPTYNRWRQHATGTKDSKPGATLILEWGKPRPSQGFSEAWMVVGVTPSPYR